jgi:hypothetical protein
MENLQSFFEEEIHTWSLAANNYAALQNIKTKSFDFGEYEIRVQFNPARAVSSLAKLDAKSIAERPCFLCEKNRPAEQRSIDFKDKYDILLNPFPICNRHFTIASKKHESQSIKGKLGDMLDLAEEMSGYVILYNGAGAGASAPDHMHFQAGNSDFFTYPFELEQPGLIRKISIISTDKKEIEDWFELRYKELQKETDREPLMNVFCRKERTVWILTVFPRTKHRPTQFFAEGSEQLMISPGAIDMAGTLIVAREEDFNKITPRDIVDIYNQVS